MNKRRAFYEIKKHVRVYSKLMDLEDSIVFETIYHLENTVLEKFTRIPNSYDYFAIAILYYYFRRHHPNVSFNLFIARLELPYLRMKVIKSLPEQSNRIPNHILTMRHYLERNKVDLKYFRLKPLNRVFRQICREMGVHKPIEYSKLHFEFLDKMAAKLKLNVPAYEKSKKYLQEYLSKSVSTVTSPEIVCASIYIATKEYDLGFTHYGLLNSLDEILTAEGYDDYVTYLDELTLIKFLRWFDNNMALKETV